MEGILLFCVGKFKFIVWSVGDWLMDFLVLVVELIIKFLFDFKIFFFLMVIFNEMELLFVFRIFFEEKINFI